jgi:hypothetical protein
VARNSHERGFAPCIFNKLWATLLKTASSSNGQEAEDKLRIEAKHQVGVCSMLNINCLGNLMFMIVTTSVITICSCNMYIYMPKIEKKDFGLKSKVWFSQLQTVVQV